MAPNSVNPPFEFSFRTRQAAWESLQSDPGKIHDVLIVGGGIVGAGIARQMKASGVREVVLIEKGDFASGSSGASSKLIHAGIRYLEQSWIHLKKLRFAPAFQNFLFVVKASKERKILDQMAPGLVKPKIIYLVLAKGDKRSSLSVWAGVWIYYLIQIFQGQFFSIPRFLGAHRIQTQFPDLNMNQVKAVFSFWDSETDDARLVIENLQEAHRKGVRIFNYAELISFEPTDEWVVIRIKNQETGETISFQARTLINATGAWIDQVRARGSPAPDQKKLVDRVAGGHMDVYPPITAHSLYITAGDGRLVFILKRDEDGFVYSRIGTTERPLQEFESSDRIKPSPEEILYLKSVVRHYFPKAALDTANLLHLDEGIRPLRVQEGPLAFNKSREHDIIQEGRVVHVVGVKLTDFRRAAGELVQKIQWSKLGVSLDSLDIVRDPIRPALSRKYYLEDTLEQLVHQTMILHWDDYVERRRGRRLAYEKRFQPEKLEKDFQQMVGLMNWDSSQKEKESGKL